jgi:HPt (histidine-containing phosphotransfer) domain-containing protein
MIEELRAQFRDRFIDSARSHLARARTAAVDADLAVIATELHALAGEAALLEFTDCARFARAGENHARAGETRQCDDVMDSLTKAIDVIAG